jgi:hypothetical protein
LGESNAELQLTAQFAAPAVIVWVSIGSSRRPYVLSALTLELTGEVISDIVITGVIAVQLIRSRTGWSGTDRLITQLLRWVAPQLAFFFPGDGPRRMGGTAPGMLQLEYG